MACRSAAVIHRSLSRNHGAFGFASAIHCSWSISRMADRLTQLQDAVDQAGYYRVEGTLLSKSQLAHQFVACIYYVHKHHSIVPVTATDVVRDVSMESDQCRRLP